MPENVYIARILSYFARCKNEFSPGAASLAIKIFLAVIILILPYKAGADNAQNAISVTGEFTYGSYSGSVQRRSLSSEVLYASYIPQPDFGIIVDIYHSELYTKAPLSDIQTTEPGATVYKFFKIGGTYLGGRVSVTYVNSDDRDTNNTLVPYGSVLFKTGDSGKYLDIGYANSDYSEATVNQYTFTAGSELFNWWLWSQTRLYYINLSSPVEGRRDLFSVEERLTYYAIPKKLNFVFYGLAGLRTFAYDPDLDIVYNLPDIQTGSAGLVASYNLTKRLTAFGAVTWEFYRNGAIANNYYVTYGTAGIKYVLQ